MIDLSRRLFVGIKISKSLQHELDTAAPETRMFLGGNDSAEDLQIFIFGEHRVIGRYIQDGCPAAAIAEVSCHVCSIVKSMTRGRRIEENEVRIYTK